ncbi:MAG TPA: MFS transporter [Gaiellales bacterium]|nr:MFS transporter [Gaiellales bacterium]
MVVGLAFVMGLVVAWALGANPARLGDVCFRGSGLVFAALAIQIAIYTSLNAHVPAAWDAPLHVLSYLLLICFLLLNVRVPAFWLVGFGLLSNVAVIFSNGGRMPVSGQAWQAAGKSLSAFNGQGISDNNVLATSDTHLRWLSDIFAVPAQVPLASVLSIGDVMMVIGMVAFVYRSCTAATGASTMQVLQPLRSAAFRRVVAGRLVSSVGDWLTQAACVTWIYESTRSVGLVSAFLATRMAGYALGGIISAPMLDRVPGFKALSVVETMRGGCTLAMIPFAAAGQIWPVVLLGALSAMMSSATSPTAQGLIPDVLPAEQLQAGNAIHQMARSLTSVVGALVGGFAVAEFSIQVALAVDLATFCVAAMLYRRFARRAGPESQPRAEPGSRVSRRDLLRAILLNRVVFGLAASFTLVTLAIGIMNSDVSRAFDDQLGNSHAYGYILAVISAGYVCSEILTGYMRSQSVARRSVGLAFLASGAAAFVLSYATTVPIAYLALFLFGAADGVTEVVRDSLIQLNTQRSVRSGVFAVVNSVQTVGMIIGLAVAPLVADRFTSGTSLRIVAMGCLTSGVLAGVCLVGRGGGAGETLQVVAAGMPAGGELGVGVAEFELRDRDGAKVTLGELTAKGPVVLVLAGLRDGGEERVAMLRELAEGLPAGVRLAVVSRSRSRLGDQAEAVRVADWLRDPGGACFAALSVPCGRRSVDAGVFVIDADGVLRLAYRTSSTEEWIPAAFVLSRVRRLLPAEPDIRVLRTQLGVAGAPVLPGSDPA